MICGDHSDASSCRQLSFFAYRGQWHITVSMSGSGSSFWAFLLCVWTPSNTSKGGRIWTELEKGLENSVWGQLSSLSHKRYKSFITDIQESNTKQQPLRLESNFLWYQLDISSHDRQITISVARMKTSRSPSPKTTSQIHTVRKQTTLSTNKCRINEECVYPVWGRLQFLRNKSNSQTNTAFPTLLPT